MVKGRDCPKWGLSRRCKGPSKLFRRIGKWEHKTLLGFINFPSMKTFFYFSFLFIFLYFLITSPHLRCYYIQPYRLQGHMGFTMNFTLSLDVFSPLHCDIAGAESQYSGLTIAPQYSACGAVFPLRKPGRPNRVFFSGWKRSG